MADICIGCHLSTSDGYAAMGRRAVEIGANTFAFFTRNPRGGNAKPLDPDDVAELRRIMGEKDFGPLVAHAPYTMNLCSSAERTVEFARTAMADDLRRMEELPGNYYNFHPGSHVKQGVDRGIELICEGLNQALFEGQHTTVLLETMAGKGTEVGRSFEELARILDGVRLDSYMGVCLDTCHVNDAGYDVAGDLDGVLDEFDRVIGLDRLKALHINDSKNPRGSHKDRHEKIGEGTLGLDAFRAVVTNPRTRTLPMILETPNDLAGYKKEISLLRGIAAGVEA
ncbi:MAG: deoxyribonuclease IV [Olsenella sp.]|jgi:deoxyribonuclease-4|nr:deoxyribonuclease IV [Olsenella sp.]MCI1288481.1 deoxyribonuclease IV [Olsenella sp.]